MALGDLREECVVHRGGEPEVEQLHADRARTRQAHVGRLEIAVHDAGRVHLGQGLAELAADRQRFVGRDLLVALDAVLERLALEQLHHVVGARALVDAEVGHLRHARGREPSQGARLAVEATDELVVEPLEPQHLQRERAPQRDVLDLEHLAHAAFAEHPAHQVALRDGAARLQRLRAHRGGAHEPTSLARVSIEPGRVYQAGPLRAGRRGEGRVSILRAIHAHHCRLRPNSAFSPPLRRAKQGRAPDDARDGWCGTG